MLLLVAGCSGDDSSQAQESQRKQITYDKLVAGQPAKSMTHSPTRDTINFWVETWNEPGKQSYVYLMASNGQLIGYYVLEGLPVSACAALTPSYELKDVGGDGDSVPDFQVPAPSLDGVYYSGGQCNVYYGKDASTGQYIEWAEGQGISHLLYEQPIDAPNVEPLGFTKVK
jgi:hypothetical protein